MRQTWLNLPLGTKIISLMSLLVATAILTLTFLSISRERANFQLELVQQSDLLLETTSRTIRDQLYRVQLDELRDIANVVSDNPDVTVFIVFDRNGRVLVDSSNPQATFQQEANALGLNLIGLPNGEIFRAWQDDQLLAGLPVVLGNQTIGAVAAGLSTVSLDQKIRSITTQGILLALVILGVGGALSILFVRQITNPLQELAQVSTRMAAGDLSIRVKEESKDEIGRLATAFNSMAAGLQEREWLRDLFGRFVSHEVAEAIRTGQVQLEGENRVVSVLFCDIREFTDFSERHTPQEVVTMLNNYLPLVVQAAQQHGGMVNKFGGDSTLIIYGAPREVQHSAYRAVLTALEIRTRLDEFNQQRIRQGEAPLRVGVGINTGVALAGAVGPNERQEYTVVGNTVNLAARIDGLNKQYPEHDILISQWTYEALDEHLAEFELISLGQVQIRGKNDPVEIWAVEKHLSV